MQRQLLEEENTISLRGSLERIVYHNDESNYSVLSLKVSKHADLVTAVGILPNPVLGEFMMLSGAWVDNPRFGMQFSFTKAEASLPTTLTGLEKYLASGFIKGVGVATAAKIVNAFGEDTINVLDNEPERLREVTGLSVKKAQEIATAWSEKQDERRIMVFLQSWGLGTGYASRIFKQYGADTIEILKANPYRLTQEVWGIGFAIADKIAASMGVALTAPERVSAGVAFALNEFVAQGHVFAPKEKLLVRTAELLGISADIVEEGLELARLEENVIVEDYINSDEEANEEDKQIESAVYLPAFHYSEVKSAENLAALVASPFQMQFVNFEQYLPALEQDMGLTLAETQKEAIKTALASKVMVITGGPGTGKTTIIRAVQKLKEYAGFKVALAAPTGRAAKRMSEATGCGAKTIHRLLECQGTADVGLNFLRDDKNPLDFDLIILDEASMIDQVLFHHILKAIRKEASLILVGDINQLPSVSSGNVLEDVIDSGICPVVRLNQIFRQGKESRIITNAHMINNGEMPNLQNLRDSDFYFIETTSENDQFIPEEEQKAETERRTLDVIKRLVTQNIPRTFGFDPLKDIQVLCPMHNGITGTKRLNIELQQVLNRNGGEGIERFGFRYKIGDKVMQIKNNYDKDIYNGDIGIITEIDMQDKMMLVSTDSGDVCYEFTELDELAPAYAISVHKSQGSEYPVCIVPLLTQHYIMLQRNLLYTAVTRGKKLVVLVGSKKALAIAVSNNQTKVRWTRLKERLQTYMNNH
ncbi:MAG: ATP-dependent RecD-like DNA helicase [Synergistaceae bacterium]|nr:ATP-dependent RecD-like DNA helicase [Synergistaceae bacterium]